jgi:hypothetical protein
VHLTTGDGRVDLRLSTNLAWTTLPDAPARYATAGWDGNWGLSAERDFPPAELRDAATISGLTLPDDGLIRVNFSVGGSVAGEVDWRLDFLAWAPGVCSGEPQPIARSRRPDSAP